MKIIKRKILILFLLCWVNSAMHAQNKLIFNPSLEIGIAVRNAAFELTNYTNRRSPDFTYDYDGIAHFRNKSLAIALKQYVHKNKISVQLATYFRYNHLYYGKNAQGLSNSNQKEYKRLKYDLFLDGLYHFKKRKENATGIILGLGVGEMNNGTKFKDSLWTGNKYELKTRSFQFFAPRLLLGLEKRKISLFVIAHGTPDIDYRPNPTIWLEFKGSYSFQLKKKSKQ
ncbi:hypothetical protein [Ferruginibacter sp.]|nr:hypothetical protein [Ferruginibacter sp.]